MNKKNELIDPPRGKTWAWVAQKGAEIDLYRQLSITNMPIAIQTSELPDPEILREYRPLEIAPEVTTVDGVNEFLGLGQ